MSFRRPDDRAESERLLDAARAGQPPPGADPLARLLAAASAPGDSTELAGEEQALAAFRAARANPSAAPAPAPRWGRFRVGVAAWTAGIAAVATAGVAVAAVNLDRSEVPTPTPPPPSTVSAGTSAGSTGAGSPSRPAQSRAASPSTGAPVPSAEPGPTGSGDPGKPAPPGNLAGHCRAYLAKSAEQRARALDTPGFAGLVTAAGGAEQVEEYCVRLVPEAVGKPPPDARSTRSPEATSMRPPARATGKPDAG
ncbi:hypothetical protein [Micromonospora eburnea]|nr:hypothetical protein [Micromonospora eburnea]